MTATPSTPHPDLPERAPSVGEMVRVRTRHWLVEEVIPATNGDESSRVRLACADDDAEGQDLEVFWDHELDRAILDSTTSRGPIWGSAASTRPTTSPRS